MSKIIPFALPAVVAVLLMPGISNAANAAEQFQAMKALNAKFSACAAITAIEQNYNPSRKLVDSFTFFRKAALLMGERTSVESSETDMVIKNASLSMNDIRQLSPERFAIALRNCDDLANAFVPKQ